MLNFMLLSGCWLTSPIDAVAMVPESYSTVVAISNLMSTDDRIEESMRGMDRGDLLLGVDPTDMIRAFAGIPAGLDDDGNLALGMSEEGWIAVLPSSDPAGMFDMNFGSEVEGRRTAMMFGSSMNISAVVRDTFGLVGSDDSISARGRGGAAATAWWDSFPEELRQRGEIFMTAPVSQASSIFASLGLDLDLNLLSQLQEAGFGVDLDAPANFVLDFDALAVSIRMRVPWQSRAMSAPISSNFEDLGPSQPVFAARLDWARLRESGLVWALATAMEQPMLAFAFPEATSFALVADRPTAEGGMMSNTRLRLEAPDVSGTANQLRSILTPTKTNGMERFSMDFPEESEFSSIFGVTSSGTMQESPGVVHVGMGGASDPLIHPDSLESAGIVDTMREWMPKTRDIEMYVDASMLSQSLGLMSDQDIPEGMPPVGFAVGMQANESGSGALDVAIVLPAPVAALMLDAAMASQSGAGS
ncbi:MAG: hypothetical protein CMJ37_03960 [Phycisphaerae bacterium]|nr:hypothetical protein [Phycisphaerae bacterium]